MTKPSGRLCDADVCVSVPEKADVPQVREHAKHPDMERTYWLPGKPAVTEEAAERLVDDLVGGWDGEGPHGAGLFIRQGPTVVGVVLLRNDPAGIEIAYGVAPAFRSHGIATRACRVVMAWLDSLGERRDLFIRTTPENGPSVGVAEHLGFVLARVERSSRTRASIAKPSSSAEARGRSDPHGPKCVHRGSKPGLPHTERRDVRHTPLNSDRRHAAMRDQPGLREALLAEGGCSRPGLPTGAPSWRERPGPRRNRRQTIGRRMEPRSGPVRSPPGGPSGD